MSYVFVRETEEDLYSQLILGTVINWDVLKKIVPTGMSHTDLFEMSLYPYGFIPNIKKFNYQIFFSCEKLKYLPIEYPNQDGKSEYYTLSYEYSPNVDNPCHFQIFVKDEKGCKLPREVEDSKTKKRNSKLAKYIILNVLKDAVCVDKTLIKEIPIKSFKKTDAIGNGILNVKV